MGLGKTFTSLKLWEKKEQTFDVNKRMIILCQSKKINDWKDEANAVFRHTSKTVKVIKTVKDFLNYDADDDILIMSFSIFTLGSSKQPKWWESLTNFGLIFDESQGLKSYSSKISIFTMRMARFLDWVILLSGDPISTGYKDLYAQMKVLNMFNSTYTWTNFLNDYCTTWTNESYIRFITGYKNVPELLERLNKSSVFIKTHEAYDLPDTWFVDEHIQTQDEYKTFYKQQCIKFKLNNGKDVEILSKNILHEMTILRELSSGILNSIHGLKQFKSNKQDYLYDLLTEINRDKTIIIFYNFNGELNQIENTLKQLESDNSENINIYRINGNENIEIKKIENKKNTFILVQYLAGAKGLDGLQKLSDRIIYYSPPLSGELYRQSIKRIHRIGQANKCIYHRFIASPLEQHIYECLETQESYSETIFKSKFKQENK